jgi:phosphoribosylglycinamide formyltransferase-1
VKIGVLASGSGTNLQAILDAARAGTLGPAEVAVVIANIPGARALARAEAAGVPAVLVDHTQFPTRAAFDEALLAALRQRGVELVALAGFMRLLTPAFLAAFPERVVNIHPSLLPAFPGLHAQRQAFDYGARVAGCTVHFVDNGLDSGPIISQATVAVHDDDDESSLTARILAEEHKLYPAALRALAEGRVSVAGRRVRVRCP